MDEIIPEDRVRTTLACHTVASGIQKRIQFLQEQQWRNNERTAYKPQKFLHHLPPRPPVTVEEPSKETETETEAGTGTVDTVSGTEIEVSPTGQAALLEGRVDEESRESETMPSARSDLTVPTKPDLPVRLPLPVGMLPLGTFAEVLASQVKDEDKESGAGDEADPEEPLPDPLPVGLLPLGMVLPPGPPQRTPRGREDREKISMNDGLKEMRLSTVAKPITTEYSVVSGALQIRWTADARRLNAVSPPFELSFGRGLPVAQFKLVLTPLMEDGAALFGQRAPGCIQVKCTTPGLPDSLPHVHLRLSVGGSDARSVSHNFGQSATCGLRADQDEWDFAPWIDPLTCTAVIQLEILPHHCA